MADAPAETKGKRGGGALKKPVTPDAKLAQVIGPDPLPRTEVTKKLWEYIRAHNLQDSENKTFIKADDKLRDIFEGKDKVSMFEMTKLVSTHLSA